MFIGQ